MDLAALAAEAAALELELHRAGGDTPLLTFALTDAGLSPRTVGGEVVEAVRGLEPADALLLAAPGLVAGVTRDGEEVLVTRRPGDRQVVERRPGRHPLLALLRRAQGLSSRPTEHEPPVPGVTWEELRTVAATGGVEGIGPDDADWMDADVFADWLTAVLGAAARE